MPLKITNAKHNANGSIDCDWDHPVHGVIRFTASPDDTEEHGRAIYQWLIDGEFGPIADADPEPEPEEDPEPEPD